MSSFAVSGFLSPVFHSLHSAIDVLVCPECGGRLRLIATITDSSVIDKILTHLGLPAEPPPPMPARLSEWLPGLETPTDWITP